MNKKIKPLIILSIETSCDESAITILEAKGRFKKPFFKILGNNVASQVQIHTKYGGVFPMMAKREHSKNLIPLFKKTLKEAKVLNSISNSQFPISKKISNSKSQIRKLQTTHYKLQTILEREPELLEQFLKFIPKIQKPDIDLIAVTYGPGLEPALWVGLNFAKALSLVWDIPVIPVNHMEGHIFSALKKGGKQFSTCLPAGRFPILSLLISGGHTELVLVKKWMDYEIIGETRDDAAGEAFDKVARLLGLPYPGGPEISKLAKLKTKLKYRLPRPMINSANFDFSFSGLKTAVLYLTQKLGKLSYEMKVSIAKEFQDAVTDVLVMKTMKAVKKYKIKTILVGGGVSANEQIRKTLTREAKKENINIYFPEKELAVDNSIMIAMAGYFRYLSKSKPPNIRTLKACGNLRLK